MKTLPPELLFILLLFGVALVQYLLSLRRAANRTPAPPLEPVEDETELEGTELEWGRARAAAPAQAVPGAPSTRERSPAVSDSVSPRRDRYYRKKLLGSRRGMRDAVVFATILGPCRAVEPHETRPL